MKQSVSTYRIVQRNLDGRKVDCTLRGDSDDVVTQRLGAEELGLDDDRRDQLDVAQVVLQKLLQSMR